MIEAILSLSRISINKFTYYIVYCTVLRHALRIDQYHSKMYNKQNFTAVSFPEKGQKKPESVL